MFISGNYVKILVTALGYRTGDIGVVERVREFPNNNTGDLYFVKVANRAASGLDRPEVRYIESELELSNYTAWAECQDRIIRESGLGEQLAPTSRRTYRPTFTISGSAPQLVTGSASYESYRESMNKSIDAYFGRVNKSIDKPDLIKTIKENKKSPILPNKKKVVEKKKSKKEKKATLDDWFSYSTSYMEPNRTTGAFGNVIRDPYIEDDSGF